MSVIPVYYQVYSDGEAIPSKNSFQEGDLYIGRIIATRIAPPHTASAVKRYLSKHENIADPSCTQLFPTLSSRTPMEDGGHVPIQFTEGPGSSPEQPLALVVSDSQRYLRFARTYRFLPVLLARVFQ
jgi:hypothetical protein